MGEAAKANRHGHRDATMILVAFRHGLRAAEQAPAPAAPTLRSRVDQDQGGRIPAPVDPPAHGDAMSGKARVIFCAT
jgi:hypothetical protein